MWRSDAPTIAAVVVGVATILATTGGNAAGQQPRKLRGAVSPAVTAPPGNDKRANATPISSLPATIRGSALGATRDASDPDCANQPLTVWYRLRPSSGGRVVATLRAAGGDICVLAEARGGLRLVSQVLGAPDIGEPVSVAFAATAGSNYYLMIGVHPEEPTFVLEVRENGAFVATWPNDLTVGPDGALWFTSTHGRASIGRITMSGHLSRYFSPKLHSPGAITVGPDGAIWFTDSHAIGRITTRGKIRTYPNKRLPDLEEIASSGGSVWFTAYNYVEQPKGGLIGQISTTGRMRLFTDRHIDAPEGITGGPDGAVWFTNYAGGSIGRIDKSGKLRFFNDRQIVSPWAITSGPDGALWFTSGDTQSIGRITVTGSVRIYEGRAMKWPLDITAGKDNALWFTNFDGASVGRISVTGAVRTYTTTGANKTINITTGRDGTIWFTDANKSIGRISRAGVVSSFPPKKR